MVIDVRVEALQVIQNIIPILGHGSTAKILSAVSPLYISAELDMRLRICDLLDALVASDASLLSVVIPVLLSPLIHAYFFRKKPYHIPCFFNFSLLFYWDAGKTSSTAECNIYFGLA